MFEENVSTMPQASDTYMLCVGADFGFTVVHGCPAAGIEARLP